MSGIFGVIDSEHRTDVSFLLKEMGQVMSHRPWFEVKTYYEEHLAIGLGKIGIGIFDHKGLPFLDTERNLAISLVGEVYDLHASDNDYAQQIEHERILWLYREYGENFVHYLAGAFAIAILDLEKRRLILTNDRFGLYPVFYAHYGGKLVFAPEMKGILTDPAFKKELDLIAMAQYVRFQVLLGERTFFEGINFLSGASVLRYDFSTDSLIASRYWENSQIPEIDVTFEEAVEETAWLLRRSVRRCVSGPYRFGVYLSGGMDSRTISGLVAKEGIDFATITYGQEGCRDEIYARKIAERIGSEHHYFEFKNGMWAKQYADLHLDLVEGYHSWIHSHGISTMGKARELIDVGLVGWEGGGVMGANTLFDEQGRKVKDFDAFHCLIYYFLTHKWQWPGLEEAEEKLVYAPDFYPKIRDLAFESLGEELVRYWDMKPDMRVYNTYMENPCRRFTFNMVTFYRSHFEVRTPFFDYALYEFENSLPYEMRIEKRLYRSVVQKELPQLAVIPYTKDAFLPTTRRVRRSAHEGYVKLKRRLNRHFRTNFAEPFTLYADYDEYLNKELHEWAESVLLDQRVAERGMFNLSFLQSLLDRQSSGLEYPMIGKIAPIMTYEMMLQRYYQ